MTSSSPAVLLLHGQPGSARDWARVAAALDGKATVVAFDRPGWDGSSAPRDLAGNAEAALAALDERGIGRATVVGHSLGGAIAAWLAAHYPERVASLVLAAPAANLASLEWFDRWLAVPVAGSLTSAASLTGLGLALSASPLRGWIARGSKLDEGYLRASGRALLTGAVRRSFDREQRSLVRDLPALESRLAGIAAPTWILTGSLDWVIPSRAPRRLAEQIPGARLIVVQRAGHLLPQLHARRLNEAIGLALDAAVTV